MRVESLQANAGGLFERMVRADHRVLNRQNFPSN